MPDHLHRVWMGLWLDSDQINGMAFLRTYLEPELSPAKFQPQPQDEVLRAEQRKRNAFAKVCFYIAANPARAKLIGEREIWPFTGCIIPGYPKLNPLDEDYLRAMRYGMPPNGGFGMGVAAITGVGPVVGRVADSARAHRPAVINRERVVAQRRRRPARRTRLYY